MRPFPLVIYGILWSRLLMNVFTGFLLLELFHKLRSIIGNGTQYWCYKGKDTGGKSQACNNWLCRIPFVKGSTLDPVDGVPVDRQK